MQEYDICPKGTLDLVIKLDEDNKNLREEIKELYYVLTLCEDYFDGCTVEGIDDPHEAAVRTAERVRKVVHKFNKD